MNCPGCDATTRVIDTRQAGGNRISRRRECDGLAKHRFVTVEEVRDIKHVFPKPKKLDLGNVWGPPT